MSKVRTAAAIALAVQLLALIRLLTEYFRMRQGVGPALLVEDVDPYIMAALVTSVLLAFSVAASFWTRYKLTIAFAVINVVYLIGYKIVLSQT